MAAVCTSFVQKLTTLDCMGARGAAHLCVDADKVACAKLCHSEGPCVHAHQNHLQVTAPCTHFARESFPRRQAKRTHLSQREKEGKEGEEREGKGRITDSISPYSLIIVDTTQGHVVNIFGDWKRTQVSTCSSKYTPAPAPSNSPHICVLITPNICPCNTFPAAPCMPFPAAPCRAPSAFRQYGK